MVPSSSAASAYLGSFRPVRPVEGFENVLSTAATAGLLEQVRQEREVEARMAGQALAEFGANERHQASLDLNKWIAEQPYKRATVADRLLARSSMLANLAGLGGARGGSSDMRQQLGAAFLAQAGQLAASRGDRFGPILNDMGNLRGLSARSQAAGAQLMDGLEGVQGSPSPALPGALPAPQLSRTTAATPVAASMTPVSGQAPVIAQTANFSDEVLRLLDEDDRRNGQQPAQKPAPG